MLQKMTCGRACKQRSRVAWGQFQCFVCLCQCQFEILSTPVKIRAIDKNLDVLLLWLCSYSILAFGFLKVAAHLIHISETKMRPPFFWVQADCFFEIGDCLIVFANSI